MHDRLQIVLQHPKTCPHRGSSLDRFKTFSRWPLALEQLETCGEALAPEQQSVIETVGRRVDVVPR
jgi:hypothetical protein